MKLSKGTAPVETPDKLQITGTLTDKKIIESFIKAREKLGLKTTDLVQMAAEFIVKTINSNPTTGDQICLVRNGEIVKKIITIE